MKTPATAVALALMLASTGAAAQTQLQARPMQPLIIDADDEAGPGYGAVGSLRITENASDDFAKFRGVLNVIYGPTARNRTEYKWGGSTCPGRNVSDTGVSLLALALANDLKVKIDHKPGQGGAKCIVDIELRR